jgi:hypothetical protein
MNMTTPFEIGLEQAGPYGEDSMFALKAVDKAHAINKIARGKMAQGKSWMYELHVRHILTLYTNHYSHRA